MRSIRPWLSVGGIRDTYDERLLTEAGVGAVLQLAQEVEYADLASLYLPVEDGVTLPPEVFDQGLAFVREQRNQGKGVLIACALGISRSVTLTIAALKEAEEISLGEALAVVGANHPESRPHPILWDSLCQRYGEYIPYPTVLHILRDSRK